MMSAWSGENLFDYDEPPHIAAMRMPSGLRLTPAQQSAMSQGQLFFGAAVDPQKKKSKKAPGAVEAIREPVHTSVMDVMQPRHGNEDEFEGRKRSQGMSMLTDKSDSDDSDDDGLAVRVQRRRGNPGGPKPFESLSVAERIEMLRLETDNLNEDSTKADGKLLQVLDPEDLNNRDNRVIFRIKCSDDSETRLAADYEVRTCDGSSAERGQGFRHAAHLSQTVPQLGTHGR